MSKGNNSLSVALNKGKTLIKRNSMKYLSVILSVLMVLGVFTPFGEINAAATIYHPSKSTYKTPPRDGQYQGDGTYIYAFDGDLSGTYGMCVSPARSGPNGSHEGTISAYSAPSGSQTVNGTSFSNAQVLSACVRAAQNNDSSNDVYWYLHYLGSKIVNPGQSFSFGSVAAEHMNVILRDTATYIAGTSNRSLYIWRDSNNAVQNIILGRAGSTTPDNYSANAYYNIQKVAASTARPVQGAVWALTTDNNALNRTSSAAQSVNRMVSRAFVLAGNSDKKGQGWNASDIINSSNRNELVGRLSSMIAQLFNSTWHTGNSYSYKPTNAQITDIYYILTGGANWTDYSGAGFNGNQTIWDVVSSILGDTNAIGFNASSDLFQSNVTKLTSNATGNFDGNRLFDEKGDFTSTSQSQTKSMFYVELCGGYNNDGGYAADTNPYMYECTISPSGGSYSCYRWTNNAWSRISGGNIAATGGVGYLANSSNGSFANTQTNDRVRAQSTISLSKVASNSSVYTSARGAEFTVYSNKACTTKLGTMTDTNNNGTYRYGLDQSVFGEKLDTDTTPVTFNIYVKETKSATQGLNRNTNQWENIRTELTEKNYHVAYSWVPSTGIMTYTVYTYTGINGAETQVTTGTARRTSGNTTNTTVANFSLGTKDNPVINPRSASSQVSLIKQDQTGLAARGAEFTVYTDAACTSSVGTMTSDNAGNYSFNFSSSYFGQRYDNDADVSKTFYIKETKAATQYQNAQGTWVNAKFDLVNDVYSVAYTWSPSHNTMSYTVRNVTKNTVVVNTRTVDGNDSGSVIARVNMGTIANTKHLPRYMESSVALSKQDQYGLAARGAEFTVYSDAACTTKVGTMTADNNGKYTYSFAKSVFGTYYDNDTSVKKTFYIKETKAATQYKNSQGTWVNAPFDLVNDVYSVAYTWNPSTSAVSYVVSKNGTSVKNGSTTANGDTVTLAVDMGSVGNTRHRPVTMDSTVSFKKVDQDGNGAKGAVFKLYSDRNCTQEVGTFVDSNSNGNYSISVPASVFGTYRDNGTAPDKVLYIKETSAATHVYIDGQWVARKTKLDNSVYSITYKWNVTNGSVSWEVRNMSKNVAVSAGSVNGTVTNDDIKTSVPVTMNDYNVPNTVLGSMKINKKTESGTALTGATFVVTDSSNKTYTVTDSDGDGIYVLEDLPVGAYTVKETVAPKYYEIDPNTYNFSISSKNPDVTVDNVAWTVIKGTVGDFIDVSPIHKTTAWGKDTGEHVAQSDTSITIVDTVEYHGLIVGKTYEMIGTLHYVDGNNEAVMQNGKAIQGTQTFVPTETDGTIDVEITFDSSVLAGNEYVIFEDLFRDNRQVGIHHELVDDQKFVVPSITTELLSSDTMDHMVPVGTTVELTDTVSYEKLQPGLEYEIKGVLVDQSTGAKILDANGDEITSSTKVKPTTKDGSTTNTFTLDTSDLKGRTLVAYEYVYLNGVLLTSEEDRNNVDQTVYIPKIETKFFDKAITDKNYIVTYGPDVKLVDTVTYENLVPNKEYTLTSAIMVKTDKAPLYGSDAKPVSITAKFTPTASSGSEDVEFTVDTTALEGKVLTAFETISFGDVVLVEEADYDNADQTVKVPQIHTTLFDEALGPDEKVESYQDTVTLVDRVEYTNLVPDKEYTMSGTLMVKETNQPLLDKDGNPVVASTKFTPKEADGTVDVVFKLDIDTTITLYKVKDVVAFEKLDYEGGITVAIHTDINDEGQTVHHPKIFTTVISDTTKEKVLPKASEITLKDTVKFENLEVGKEYVMSGVLMDLATGKPILDNGKQITGTTTFTPTTKDGTVDVFFKFNSEVFANKTVVAFETCTRNGVTIAVHNDLEDKDQTAQIPDLHTTFYDRALGEDFDMTTRGTKVTLVDKVEYSNLIPGKEYSLTGLIMVKSTNEPYKDADGNIVTVTKKFTPKESEGFVNVEFTVDTTTLEGEKLVAFETLEVNNATLVIHADIDDTDQTVDVPKAKTRAWGKGTNSNYVPSTPNVVLVDTVDYENLQPGKEYEVKGKLVDKVTGEVIKDKDGKEITSTKKFTPKTSSGSVDIEFNIDGSLYQGRTFVVFEDVFYDNKLVATHADITDEQQTVYVPKAQTSATVNGKKEFNPKDTVELVDTISYTNLEVGRKYIAVGTLMYSDGNEFLIDGKPVTVEKEFVPETKDGTVDVTFTFKAAFLKNGTNIVVFEKIYTETTTPDKPDTPVRLLITTHEDLTDTNQTVTTNIALVTTTGEADSIGYVCLAMCSLGIALCLVLLGYKKRRGDF